MARTKVTNIVTVLVGYFSTAPIAEADNNLMVADAIVQARHTAGLVQPALVEQPAKPNGAPTAGVARRAPRPPRQRKLAEQPVNEATPLGSAPAKRKPGRPVGSTRPPVPETVAAPAAAVGGNPLPDPGGPLGEE